ncbi:MAG: carbamoyltransferase HypF [Gammaproteobacteria bacterium]|nr:carbamoyltransferase HypF [Gammaproteobacteria bacterium]MBU0787321.1 carbamoyltransferase HypF [Gammaproteobacteria bacterium]MBU0816061.1 carbamoyltransferase HypF [Gammaproteobacteria bacterium]MBU1787600.1 carbamoyltransferase HypF [Gammaproteobacteria bacterium]
MTSQVHSSRLPAPAPARVLACGAYLKNRACLIDGDTVYWSRVHGDLGKAAHCEALERSVETLLSQATGPLHAVAHDLHPDFHSTRLALSLAHELGVPAQGVQHHHAHIGVTLAEQALASPVIGIALDGVGLGTDGTAWGGELLWLDGGLAAHRWLRLDHLTPLPMPGADMAAREPWRMAAAALHALGRGNEIVPRFAPLVGATVAQGVQTLLQRQLQCPVSSSAGRWFDAAAGALGLSVRQAFEAEAAISLEKQAREWLLSHPGFSCPWQSLDLTQLLGELLDLPQNPETQGQGAAMFHLALASGLAYRTLELAQAKASSVVVLGGGCFVNRVLRDALIDQLRLGGQTVYQPQDTPCGDAGLALGQAWIAACKVHPDAMSAQALRSPLAVEV